jgi:DNA-binding NtrC family response regulator
MAELIFSRGSEILFQTTLSTRSFRVGGNPLNDMCLPDENAAPFAVSFESTSQDGTSVVDRSGQGVCVNGAPVEGARLKDGDTVKLGSYCIGFRNAVPQGSQRTAPLAKGETTLASVWLEGADGRRFAVGEQGTRVGKDDSNDVVIADSAVSSFHAMVYRRGTSIIVRDLNSTNGTFINSVRITEAEAPLDGTLTFARVAMQVVGSAKAAGVRNSAARIKTVGELVYADTTMDAVASAIRSVAPHDASVCIMGESGTGKELVARAIHALGPRASEPFVAVNCAAISPQLVESELFGHERGAFTGAERTRMGAFEEAGRGTLFLDEVGDLPSDAQAKLLRALENRETRRVGGDGARRIHCRVITATHQNLMQRVSSGVFRNDLLHRLTVLPIRVPALRDRKADIAVLAEHFLKQLGNGKTHLLPAAVQKLQTHPFPGNVRELRNVLLQAIVFSGKTALDGLDISFPVFGLEDIMAEAKVYQPGKTLADIEHEAIEQAVQVHGSHAAAARELGIARSTLIAKVQGKSRREVAQ